MKHCIICKGVKPTTNNVCKPCIKSHVKWAEGK